MSLVLGKLAGVEVCGFAGQKCTWKPKRCRRCSTSGDPPIADDMVPFSKYTYRVRGVWRRSFDRADPAAKRKGKSWQQRKRRRFPVMCVVDN